MKMINRLISLALAGVTALSLTSCTSGKDTYTIGICQFMQHDALNEATQGFKDALNAEFGEKVTFLEQDASGDRGNCSAIVDGFISSNVDLILANATTALQAAAAATSEIPVLGTSVTDYATALEINDWNGTVGRNISGTSDLPPVEKPLAEQASMIQELFPDAAAIGLLYCSAEPNSIYQVTTIAGYLGAMGYDTKQYAFTDINDMASVTQTACDNCDVIYVPADNTAAANTGVIADVVLAAGVPVVTGEEGICEGCGVAALSISYYELGNITGQMAVKILKGESKISEMPIEYAPSARKVYNADNAGLLGIFIPDDYVAIGE